ncbi:hypothetical protein SCNRRL3882_3831 [Streptomyces chartreusis NRRL 3882]|uniref:Uncharacterized protein n=1 Tax=Streptomyces chartreusis NRRL 3882 TaxID=1079985 RepID=A0A2N9BAK0_STRCX|nr:hypothetical protein SCNRRL3882_3831 [Streptomyces chartreusis NRRL 3882]
MTARVPGPRPIVARERPFSARNLPMLDHCVQAVLTLDS